MRKLDRFRLYKFCSLRFHASYFSNFVPSNAYRGLRCSRTWRRGLIPACAHNATATEMEENNDKPVSIPGPEPVDLRAFHSLTGPAPFNGELSLSSLLSAGFVTPTASAFIENGQENNEMPFVPENYHLTVYNSVDSFQLSSVEYSLSSLLALPAHSVMATVASAALRRKELNQAHRTCGWDSGPGLVANCQWTGVSLSSFLSSLLERFSSSSSAIRYVAFESDPAREINGNSRRTCFPIEYAMDPARELLLCHTMNGRPLPLSHGYPLRLIVPGHVAQHSIKGILAIYLMPAPMPIEQFPLDVRVLHSTKVHHVGHRASEALASVRPSLSEFSLGQESLAMDSIVFEMRVNSMIAGPAHLDLICLKDFHQPVSINGVAFSGGGKAIKRVEISVDGGLKWQATTLNKPNKSLIPSSSSSSAPSRYDYTWTFWSVSLPAWVLFSSASHELVCRATDDSGASQPRSMNWNIMGIMNNSWYRVKYSFVGNPRDPHQPVSLSFRHPVTVDGQSSGWLRSEDDRRVEHLHMQVHPFIANHSPSPASLAMATRSKSSFTLAEVAQHNHSESCWIVIDENIYDVTTYLAHHPAGAKALLNASGGHDCTALFHRIHPDSTIAFLAKFFIGRVSYNAVASLSGRRSALNPNAWTAAVLVAREQATPDTYKMTFELKPGQAPLQATKAADPGKGQPTQGAGQGQGTSKAKAPSPSKVVAVKSGPALVAESRVTAIANQLRDGAHRASYHEQPTHASQSTQDGHDSPSSLTHSASASPLPLCVGIPPGHHILLRGLVHDEFVTRPYSPIEPVVDEEDRQLRFTLIIKVYPKGKLSNHMKDMAIGQQLDCKGPIGHVSFHPGQRVVEAASNDDNKGELTMANCIPPYFLIHGYRFTVSYPSSVYRLSIIAGGSGITPVLAILRALHHATKDNNASNRNECGPGEGCHSVFIEASLIYGNNSIADIICYNELAALERDMAGRLRLYHVAARVSEAELRAGWSQGVGFVTPSMIEQRLFPPAANNLVLLCGPPPLLEFACYPFLAQLGYERKNILEL